MKESIPGVKLPRSKQRWEDANLYFKVRLPIDSSTTIEDIDSYALNMQEIIYDYFASSEGTVKTPEIGSFGEKYKNHSVKQLKRELAVLKSNKTDGDEIRFVSRLIRQSIKRQNSSDVCHNIESQLSKSFWKTCKKIFNTTENALPSFDIVTCHKYFKQALSQVRKYKVFKVPTWLMQLHDPTINFKMDPPSYQEVARAVRRGKSRASPCPLDQISVIALKKCPQLRTALHHLLVACWSKARLPECWKHSLSILLHKKGETSDPSNFRPITLEPVLYKIYATILRDRLFNFISDNNYIDTKCQKGFWRGIDGVAEHSQLLNHIIKDAKRHQRSLFVTLIDLRNAFGEIHHNLIKCALSFHHVPEHITNIVTDIYTHSYIHVANNGQLTTRVAVERGVLQGDVCSPILFNMCTNILMVTIATPKYQQFGYMWGPNAGLRSSAWLQFADDTALIAQSIEGAQALLSTCVAWSHWADMQIRID